MTRVIPLISLAVAVAGYAIGAAIDPIAALSLAMLIAFSVAGAVVARRQSRNPLGWLLLGVGFAAALAVLSDGIAENGLDRGGEPGRLTKVAAAYGTASWIPLMLPGLTFLLLLFPDGRLLSRRWRIVAASAGVGIAASFAGEFFRPGPLEDYPQIDNPLGWPPAEAFEVFGMLFLLVGLVGGPVALIKRFRSAGYEQRQQIKWLAAVGVVAAVIFVLGVAALLLGAGDAVVYIPMMASVVALPIAVGVAIVRHRLYDVDLVINRTLVYGALTGTLAATYLGTVLLLQLVLPERSDLAIAGSTLAAAALVRPARARIQAAVDRRFFRRRYDAARTLEGFGTRTRDEVELATLSSALTAVAAETMQPAHVSLWLRER